MHSLRSLSIPGLLALMVSTSPAAEHRIFTTTDGQFLDGYLVSATADQATVKTADGKQTTIATSKLIRGDREYIGGWLKAHPAVQPVTHYSFDVAWSKDRTASKVSGRDHTRITRNTYVTHFKIQNRSGQPADNIDLHYQVYYMDVQGTTSSVRHKDGVIKLAPLSTGASITVDASPVELEFKQLMDGYTYTSGAPVRQVDSFRGVVATFMHEGAQVFEYVTPGITKAPEKPAKKKTGT